MQSALDNFHVNINYAKNLGALHSVLEASTTEALDLSDILRAEFVISISALDHYIHELVEAGMRDIYNKKRPPTSKFLSFNVALGSFWQDTSVLASHDWLIEGVRSKHSFRSFQHPERIAEVIKLISDVKLWEEVGKKFAVRPEDVRGQLELVVDRRNKIVHEADTDRTIGSRWPIDAKLVDDTISFIETLVDALNSILK